jgi:hypothetical protein
MHIHRSPINWPVFCERDGELRQKLRYDVPWAGVMVVHMQEYDCVKMS